MTTGRTSDCSIGYGNDRGINALKTPLECDRCHAEIPATVVFGFEGAEYVYHFCGPQCIEAWCKATNAHDK